MVTLSATNKSWLWACLKLATAWCALACGAAATPVVWSGFMTSFTKLAGADPSLAANQDHLTSHVALTRGDTAGLFNAVLETSFDRTNRTSPLDTEWATDLNNPGLSIEATNWAVLEFSTWNDAYGGMGGVGSHIVDRDAVVHLITDDIYLNLRFTAWGGNQGGFTYLRSAALASTGDYNGNHVVDAADYILWRNSFGQSVTPRTGADGDGDGVIGPAEYTFWAGHFGNTFASTGSGASAAVPEPTSITLAVIGLLATAALCTLGYNGSPLEISGN
jgi:hypothetical protein